MNKNPSQQAGFVDSMPRLGGIRSDYHPDLWTEIDNSFLALFELIMLGFLDLVVEFLEALCGNSVPLQVQKNQGYSFELSQFEIECDKILMIFGNKIARNLSRSILS